MSLPNPIDLPARFVGYHPLVPLGVVIPHTVPKDVSQVTNQRPKGAGPIEAHLRFASQADPIAAEARIAHWGLRLGAATPSIKPSCKQKYY